MTTTPETTQQPRANALLHEILSGSALRTVLAVFLGFFVGSLFMIFSNEDVLGALGGFFTRPGDFFAAAGAVVGSAAGAIGRGALYNPNADDVLTGLRPFTESLRLAAPLIAAGLGIALGFRVGLFNIGGTGQLMFGAASAAWISFQAPMPIVIHLIVAIVVGVLASALWGAIAGFLKAKTGAHEVIVTIMLNYIALNLVTWLMRNPAILQDPSVGGAPKTLPPDVTAQLPGILGSGYALHLGFLIVVAATVVYWWLMERSVLGYQLRMVGFNPNAARTSGINIQRVYIIAMSLSAAFVGLAAINQALGRDAGFTPSLHGGIGFDAITVALLGGGSAWGVFFAGLLFGAFKASGPAMQVAGISPEVLGIVQGAIVLFIAAPPLIRTIFRLPHPDRNKRKRKPAKTEGEGLEQ
jgi:general nucleoside transport system permease protein